MLLEVRDLAIRYGRTQAVDGLTFGVEAGEVVTILGSNGAGKTSTLRCLQGLTPAFAGKILFDGADVMQATPAQRLRRGLVLVPEGRLIAISLTVHENLLMGAYCRDDADIAGEIKAIYERFPNLGARRDMPASVLSGGEQQMLAISRALLARPKLMMLDEPSLGLSPLMVERLFDLLAALNQEGLGILLVEQNTTMALELARRGLVLELGKMVAAGPAEELASDDRLTSAYLGAH